MKRYMVIDYDKTLPTSPAVVFYEHIPGSGMNQFDDHIPEYAIEGMDWVHEFFCIISNVKKSRIEIYEWQGDPETHRHYEGYVMRFVTGEDFPHDDEHYISAGRPGLILMSSKLCEDPRYYFADEITDDISDEFIKRVEREAKESGSVAAIYQYYEGMGYRREWKLFADGRIRK